MTLCALEITTEKKTPDVACQQIGLNTSCKIESCRRTPEFIASIGHQDLPDDGIQSPLVLKRVFKVSLPLGQIDVNLGPPFHQGEIKPICHAARVSRIRQQAVYKLDIFVRRGVRDKSPNLGCGWRFSNQVERDSANQCRVRC